MTYNTRSNQIEIEDLSVCYFCDNKELIAENKFCPHCGFPQLGTQAEQKRFIWNVRNKSKLLKQHKDSVKRGQIILFILGGLDIIIGIITGLFIKDDLFVLISNLIIGAIFISLGFWANKKPFPALLSGLIVYITLLVINGIIDWQSIFNGLVIKILIIAAFFYGFRSINESKNISSELDLIKKAQKQSKQSNDLQ
jgi:hypothetical protein